MWMLTETGDTRYNIRLEYGNIVAQGIQLRSGYPINAAELEATWTVLGVYAIHPNRTETPFNIIYALKAVLTTVAKEKRRCSKRSQLATQEPRERRHTGPNLMNQ